MGLPVTYCPICGGPFEIPARYNEPTTGSEPINNIAWIEDLQLFALPSSLPRREDKNRDKDEGPPEPLPTEQPCFFGPATWVEEPGDFRYDGRIYVGFYSDKFGNIVFPMHKACAEIIRRVVELKEKSRKASDPAISLRNFYNALRRRQEADMQNLGGGEYQGLWWKHEYYGAVECWDYSCWDDERDNNEIFLADPIRIADTTSYVLGLLQPAPLQQPGDRTRSLPSNHPVPAINSRLATLPRELFDRICDFLPSSSLLELRLSCKTFASYIQLDQRFFLSLLVNGFDVPYLWDLDVSACFEADKTAPNYSSAPENNRESSELELWDWRGLARGLTNLRGLVKKEIPGVDLPAELWNRMRIWLIVEEALKG